MGRTFRGQSFDSVGRVVWLGATSLVFSARKTGEAQFHLFQVDLVGFNFQQLTTGLASEENPTISPDGRWIAFDSNAVPTVSGVSYVGGGAPAMNLSAGDPARASAAPGTVRNIFVMPSSGVGVPQQFTGRFTGAHAVSNVHPAWSSNRTNIFTNGSGATQYLAFSSTRQISGSSVVSGTTKDIYVAPVTTNNAQTILSENSATVALQIDVADSAFAFDDEYPAWSPIIALTRIAMQSNRTGNFLVNSYPATGFSATPGVRDLFLASIIDINAPTLIRFDTNATAGEVVHINLGNTYNSGQSVRTPRGWSPSWLDRLLYGAGRRS